MPSESEKKTRQAKSPAQKAQEALDISARKLARLRTREKALENELKAVKVEQELQGKEHDYLAANPHLSPVQNKLADS